MDGKGQETEEFGRNRAPAAPAHVFVGGIDTSPWPVENGKDSEPSVPLAGCRK